eukprot:12892687-Prorocentrum_lima.AAC.1
MFVNQNTLWREVHCSSNGREQCSHDTIAGSGETHSEGSSGSHQEPNDDADFFDAKNDCKPPPGIVPEPGFHN